LLLLHKANPCHRDLDGNTPIDEAQYWWMKYAVRDSTSQARHCCIVAEILRDLGGKPSRPKEHGDPDRYVRRLSALAQEATARGISHPWPWLDSDAAAPLPSDVAGPFAQLARPASGNTQAVHRDTWRVWDELEGRLASPR